MIRTFVHESGAVLVHRAIGRVTVADLKLAVVGYTTRMPPSVLWDLTSGKLDLAADELAAAFIDDVLPRANRIGAHLRAAIVVPNRGLATHLEDAIAAALSALELAAFVEHAAALDWLNDSRDDGGAFSALEGEPVELDGRNWRVVRLERHDGQAFALLTDASDAAGTLIRRPLTDVLERIALPVELSLPETC